jgi:hypothetical protein
MKNILITFAIIAIGIVVLIMLGNYLVTIRAVPSLSEYIASTTASLTSVSSDQIASISDSNQIFPDNNLITSTTSSNLATSSNNLVAPENITSIKTSKGTIQAEIVDTPALLEKGLSDRDSLLPDHGMLFVFYKIDKYEFWMKDMRFPIDIVWIDADKIVIEVDSNVSPDSYPNSYAPSAPVKYVLELNAGMAEKMGMNIGTKLEF